MKNELISPQIKVKTRLIFITGHKKLTWLGTLCYSNKVNWSIRFYNLRLYRSDAQGNGIDWKTSSLDEIPQGYFYNMDRSEMGGFLF